MQSKVTLTEDKVKEHFIKRFLKQNRSVCSRKIGEGAAPPLNRPMFGLTIVNADFPLDAQYGTHNSLHEKNEACLPPM